MNKYNLLANGFGQIQPDEESKARKASNNKMESSEGEPCCSKPNYGQVLRDALAGIRRIRNTRVSSSVSDSVEEEVEVPSPMNLLPPKVLEKILSYVGLNNGARDLRCCRLVCTKWNQVALQLLSPCTLTLSIDQLQAQMATNDCEEKETNLDKLLHNYIRQNKDNKDNGSHGHDPPPFNINLTYKGNCFTPDVQFIFKKILALQESNQMYPITSIHLAEAGDCFLNDPTLLIQMIGNSGPNIKSLKLLDSALDDTFPAIITTKENSLIQVLNTIHTSSIALQALELAIYDEPSLTSLTTLKLNDLKSLHLHQPSNATLRREFGSLSDFLALNCPQLTKFEVTVYEFGLHYGNYQFNNYESALGLVGNRSKLTDLGFYYVEAESGLHVCTQLSHKGRFCNHLAYLSDSFEALQTLSTDLATFIALIIRLTPEIAAHYEYFIVFPSVSTLSIKIRELTPLTFNNSQDEIDFMVGVQALVERWMPNLTKLILDVDSTVSWSGPANHNRIFLETMVGTFLDVKGIKGLELVNYVAQDVLFEIGMAGPCLAELTQKLEYLRLRRSFPGPGPVEDEEQNPDPETYLSELCTIFPNLRLLQIDYDVLKGAPDAGTLDFEQLLDKINLIKAEFPNVQFQLF